MEFWLGTLLCLTACLFGNSPFANAEECASMPCLHGGVCVEFGDSYACICPQGYKGRNCETELDECVHRPCANNGTCVDEVNTHRCHCTLLWQGVNCTEVRKADVIFYGGSIITMEEGPSTDSEKYRASPKPEAVAIVDDIILAVGSMEEVFHHVGPETQVIFLDQQALMPGFIEPHQHIILSATVKGQSIPIGGDIYRSYAEVRSKMMEVLDSISQDPSKPWTVFFGWDPELIRDLPSLSAKFLDETFSSTLPIFVMGQSGHVAWVNQPALNAVNYTKVTPNPVGGTIVRDADGNPTGQLFEAPPIAHVLNTAYEQQGDPMAIVQALLGQFHLFAAAGFTTVTELVYQPNSGVDGLLQHLSSAETFPLRIALYRLMIPMTDDNPALPQDPLGGGIGNYSSRLWETGIKLIADGSPHTGTAAIREPYLNTPLTENLGFPKAPTYGHLNIDNQALLDTVRRFHLHGRQVAIHAHGERAAGQVLHALEQILAEYPNFDNRHRIEHLGLMTVDQIKRAGKLDIGLSFFVDHLRFYAPTYANEIFGLDRVNRWTPLSAATESNVIWTIHQDHPTFPGNPNPFANMKTAVTRCHRDDPTTPYGPEYRVSIHEALKAYTINAAWQLHLDQKVGSIEVGKKADLVVLSENPYNVDPFDLESIKVISTYIDGRRNFATVKTIPGSNIAVLV